MPKDTPLLVVEPETKATPPTADDVMVSSGGAQLAPLFERLATDPNVDVEKFERLMALWERIEAKRSERAFNTAMAAAQKEMRPVATDAYNPSTKSRYASYEALDEALRPIYTRHGFGLSFNTGVGAPVDYVRVLCKASQSGGHSELYTLDMPADGKGAKGGDVMTKTHATGSALTYGQRYLLKMIFNIAVGEGDDDGNKAGGRGAAPEPPQGYETWWSGLQTTAERGLKAFEPAWECSDGAFKNYAHKWNREGINELKKKAAAASKAGAK